MLRVDFIIILKKVNYNFGKCLLLFYQIKQRSFVAMKLLNVETLTPEHIEFINAQNAEGKGLREIIRDEMKAKSVTPKVRNEVKKIKEKLEQMGYVLIDGFYKLDEKEEDIVEEIKEEVQQEDGEIVQQPEQQVEKSNTKKPYLTKKKKAEEEEQKRKEREEKLKKNPFTGIYSDDVLKVVDDVAVDIAKGKVKNIGVYTTDKVEEAFKLLQNRFYYIPNYLLISACVYFTEKNVDKFMKSKWVEEFSKAYHEDEQFRKFKNDTESSKKLKEEKKEITSRLEVIKDKKEFEEEEKELKIRLRKINSELRRKQTNVKMSSYVATTLINVLKAKFPFLSQSDIILMCMYSFSYCMNENEEELRKYLEEFENKIN